MNTPLWGHSMIDWTRYLESVCKDQEYTEWEKVFVRLDAEAPAEGTKLDLMIQAFREPDKSEQGKDFPPPKEVQKYDALEGLRKFAGEHVLLRGRPGSGKTTTSECSGGQVLYFDIQEARPDPKNSCGS